MCSNALLLSDMMSPGDVLANKLVVLMNKTTVKQLGNSAAVILPKALRNAAGIEIGDCVTVDSPEPGTVVIKAEEAPWTLTSLMTGYNGPKPEIVDTGEPVGREMW